MVYSIEQNKSSSLVIMCWIARITVHQFDLLTGGHEIKVAICVKF